MESPPTYRIRNWEKHFEKAQTRGVKFVTWIPVPNKHDGKGYRRLIRMKDGESLYAAWILILGVASKCPVRGTLVDGDGEIITAGDLADKTGAKQNVFERALNMLCTKEINWIEVIGAISTSQHTEASLQHDESTIQDVATTGQDRTGHNKTVQIPPPEVCSEPSKDDSEQSSAGENESATAKTIMVFPCVGRGPTEWPLSDAKVEEYRQSFPAVDVLGICRTARQWCIDNPSKRKTFGGMAAFLSRWLSKEQNRSHERRPVNLRNGPGQIHDPAAEKKGF